MSEDRRTGNSTVPRDGPLVQKKMSRPAVMAAKSQFAIAAIDTSGSMSGTKIEEARAAVVALLAELADPKNRGAFHLAVVIYGNDARVHLAKKPATEVRPEDLAVSVGTVGSWTNITAGLTAAHDLIEKARTDQGDWLRPVVILLTDGQANTGGDPAAIATTLKGKADLLAVAFGADANLPKLQSLATSPAHALRCANGAELRKFFATVGRTMSQAARTGGGTSVAALLGGTAGGVLRG